MFQGIYVINGIGTICGADYNHLISNLRHRYSQVDILNFKNNILTFKYHISTTNKAKYINLLNACRKNKLSLFFYEDYMIRMSKQQDLANIDVVITPTHIILQNLNGESIKLTQEEIGCTTLAQQFLGTIVGEKYE